jgi:hypothetical protein
MLACALDDLAMRIVRIALVAALVLAGATACKKSDAEDKSLPEKNYSVPAADAPSAVQALARM